MSGDGIKQRIDADEVLVDNSNLVNTSGQRLQEWVEDVDGKLLDNGQPVLIHSYYQGIVTAGSFVIGSAEDGLPAVKDGGINTATVQFQSPPDGVVTLRLKNLTKFTESIFVMVGDGVQKFFKQLFGAPLLFDQGDLLAVLIDSVELGDDETGGSFNLHINLQ